MSIEGMTNKEVIAEIMKTIVVTEDNVAMRSFIDQLRNRITVDGEIPKEVADTIRGYVAEATAQIKSEVS